MRMTHSKSVFIAALSLLTGLSASPAQTPGEAVRFEESKP